MTNVSGEETARAAEPRSRRVLEALFVQALNAILLLDDRGVFVDVNPSAEEMFGYSLDEFRRMRFTNLTPAPSDAEAEERWSDFRACGKQVGEFPLRRKDGTMIDVDYFAVSDIQPGVNLVIVRDVSDRKRTEAALTEHKSWLEALARKLVHAQEEERGRIARELHDEIGQTLMTVSLGLDAIERSCTCGPGVSRQLHETRDAVQLATEQVRTVSQGLRPLILDDLGLPSALRWYLDRQAQHSGLPIHFENSIPDSRLAPEVETACFRIVQEALTNVFRHSSATNVRITLSGGLDRVQLEVQDDGVGFDLASALGKADGSGLGLIGMRERVRILEGNIVITSRPGKGVGIYVTLPLNGGAGVVR